MQIEKITGLSSRGSLITETLANFKGTVSEALAKFFKNGSQVDSGDSPYELAVYSEDGRDDLGCINLTKDEARTYLAEKHGLQRAKAILGEFDHDWHESHVRPYV